MQCYDIPAPGVGRRCGPCPLGYTGDGITCTGVLDIFSVMLDLYKVSYILVLHMITKYSSLDHEYAVM